MDKMLEEFVENIKKIDSIKAYDEIMSDLNKTLSDGEYPESFCQDIRNKQKYIKNRFSDEINKEKMLVAKENVMESLLQFIKKEKEDEKTVNLIQYLQNFYLFLETFAERDIDKRATLKNELLKQVKIENEYDLQHLLCSVLKPLYPDIRKEVSEDSGVGTVRTDLKIPCLNVAIEAKCTRDSMQLKKLTEEIEADIVHYTEQCIVFIVYDKVKLIKEKQNYETCFNRTFDGKKIIMIILQPIQL